MKRVPHPRLIQPRAVASNDAGQHTPKKLLSLLKSAVLALSRGNAQNMTASERLDELRRYLDDLSEKQK